MKVFFACILALSGSLAYGQAPPDYPPAPPAKQIVKAEYYFDTDPGLGNGTAIDLDPSASDFTTTINLNGSALTTGFHKLYIRTLDTEGKWSLTHYAQFDNVTIPNYPGASASAPNMVELEYFIDTDPGLGNGKKIPLPSQQNVASFNALIDISGLNSAAHRLYIRAKDANGIWSLTYIALFDNAITTPYPTAPAPAPPLSQAEYYFDTDPGFGNGTPITINPSENTFSFDASLASLSQGRHTIYVRSRQNPWSMSAYAEFLFGNALPVTWVYVKAETRDKDAMINWATASEQNAAKFIIEVSKDGVNYTAAGEVPAKNNASGSSYSFRHINPGPGTSYYRIKQVDKDDKSNYSKIVLLLFRDGISKPLLFPNPATSVVHVYMPQAMLANRIEVYDAGGRFVKSITPVAGTSTVSVPITDLPKGRYVLTIINGKERTPYNFVKN